MFSSGRFLAAAVANDADKLINIPKNITLSHVVYTAISVFPASEMPCKI